MKTKLYKRGKTLSSQVGMGQEIFIIGCYEKNSQNKKKLFKVKDIIIES